MDELLLWLKCAGIRALKTMAQAALGVIGSSFILSQVDWKVVLSASLLAGIVSLLTSVAGIPEVAEGKNLSRLIKGE